MKKITLQLAILSAFTVLPFTLQSCGNDRDTVSCFPQNQINAVINLNLPAYQSLQNVGGWIYLNEQGSGSRGLIIVRATSGFKVYDRNAPHICPDSNTTLNVVDNIKIVCPKDGAEWILITGEPIKTAQVAPKNYPYTYDAASNVISIYY